MDESSGLTLFHQVAPAEAGAMTAAARHLLNAVRAAGLAQDVRLRPLAALTAGQPVPAGAAVLSLMTALEPAAVPVGEIFDLWSRQLLRLRESGLPCVVCTVFRYVPGAGRAGAPSRFAERLLRLNHMAAELSRSTGAAVADIDRDLGLLGARRLAADWRLGSELASALAGHAIARALLHAALDERIAPDAFERADAALGTLPSALTGRGPLRPTL